MAFCEGCGATLMEDSLFCETCGRPVPRDGAAGPASANAVATVSAEEKPAQQAKGASDAATQVARSVARVVKEISSAAPNELGESVIASWRGTSF